MSIVDSIAAMYAQAETVFPTSVMRMYWGENQQDGINVLRSDPTQYNGEHELSGVVLNIHGGVRVLLSRCDPWEPPEDGDIITLEDSEGNMARYSVIGHTDDQTGTTRMLVYGEESA